MKKKITIYLIAVITIVNLSSLGTIIYLKWKQDRKFNLSGLPVTEEMRAKKFQQMKEELNLTPQQIEQFEIIRKEFHSRLDSLDEKAQTLRSDMIKEIWESESDSGRVEDIIYRFGILQNETQRWVVKHFYKFKEVLTPEQSEKFFHIVSERFAGMQKNSGLRQMPIHQEDCK